MSKNQFWQESLHRNLTTAHGFFQPRGWSQDHNKIWLNVLNGWPADQIDYAFKEYYAVGKHMPKPSEIIEILRKLYPPRTDRERNDERLMREESGDERECDPIIATAWVILIGLQNTLPIRIGVGQKRVPMTDDQAVMICNLEAKRLNHPDAIAPEFWLREVWGRAKPARTVDQMLSRLRSQSPQSPVPDYSYVLRGQAA
jgi:hypothetical protein